MRSILIRRLYPSQTTARRLLSSSFSSDSATTAIPAVSEPSHGPQLYNSLSFRNESLPSGDRPLLFYGASSTLYADRARHAHLYMWWDVWRRTLISASNAEWVWCLHDTNGDDDAKQWTKTWDALGLLQPDQILRTSEHVESTILPYIQRMIDSGVAYTVDGLDVYFHVPSIVPASRYGILAPSFIRTIQKSSRSDDGRSRLRDDRDILLWEAAPVREDAESAKSFVAWASPWGHGKPTAAVSTAALLEHTLHQNTGFDPYVVRVGRAEDKMPEHVNEMAIRDAADSSAVDHQHWVHTGVITEATHSRSNDYLYASRDHLADPGTVEHDPAPKLRTLLKRAKGGSLGDVLRWWALQRTYYEPAVPFEHPTTLHAYRAEIRTVIRFLSSVDRLPVAVVHTHVNNATSSVKGEQLNDAVNALDLWNSNDPQKPQPMSIGGAINDVLLKGRLCLSDASAHTSSLHHAARVLRTVLHAVGFTSRVWEAKQNAPQTNRTEQPKQTRPPIIKSIPVSTKSPTQQHKLPPERMFIDGLDYTGMFSAFDHASGLPTHAAIDGQPLSNRQRKLFRQLHRKRQKDLDKLAHQRRRKIIQEAERRRKEEEYREQRQPWRRGYSRTMTPPTVESDQLQLQQELREAKRPLTKRQERLKQYRLKIRRKKRLHRRG